MIFKTTDDIKGFVPVNITFDFSEIQPFIKQAEQEILIPAISQAQYDDINNTYNNNPLSLTTNQKNLLDKMRQVIAPLSYMYWIPWGQVQISSAGIRIANTPEMKTAFSWQIDALEKSAARTAANALEGLMDFLETNISIYTIYAASAAHTDATKYFINSGKDFSLYYNINNSRLFYNTIKPSMKKVEDFDVIGILGADLFAEIKTQISSAAISANNAKLMGMIKGALAHLTIAKSIIDKALIVDDNGVSAVTRGLTFRPDLPRASDYASILDAMYRNALQDGETYGRQLRNYLNLNATASVYPLYFSSSLYVDPTKNTDQILTDKSFGIQPFM